MIIRNVYIAKKSLNSSFSSKFEKMLRDSLVRVLNNPIEHEIMLIDDFDEEFDINFYRHEIKIALEKDMPIIFASKFFKNDFKK